MSGKSIGKYEIVEELGRGGMGVVYKAWEETLQRHVAIKMLGDQLVDDENLVARFLREARAVADLNHPNVVQVFAVDTYEGRPYFAMEYVEGDSLAHLIRREHQMDPSSAARLLKEAATGLGAAHAKGVVHRDVKPDNIMQTKHGGIKLVDFGIARVDDPNTRLTATGMAMGTPRYISPEVCLGQEVDHQSDIFSLGIVLYEMLAGNTPFQADSPLEMMTKIARSDVPDITTLNPSVDDRARRILAHMLAKDRAHRYRSCTELIADLDAYIAGAVPRHASAAAAAAGDLNVTEDDATPLRVTPAAQPSSPARPARPGSRLAWAAVLLLLVGGASAAGWWYFGDARPVTAEAASADDATPTIAAEVVDEPAIDSEPADVGSPASPPLPPADDATVMENAVATIEAASGIAASPAMADRTPEIVPPADEPAIDTQPADVASPASPPLPPADDAIAIENVVATTEAASGTAASPTMADQTPEIAAQADEPATPANNETVEIALVDNAPSEPPAPVRPQPTPQPRDDWRSAPRLVVVVSGDPAVSNVVENVLESALATADFTVMDEQLMDGFSQAADLASLGSTMRDNGADIMVYADIVSAGQRQLEFFGRTEQQSVANLEVRALLLAERRNLGAPWQQSLRYVPLNASAQARSAAEPIADELVGRLQELGVKQSR